MKNKILFLLLLLFNVALWPAVAQSDSGQNNDSGGGGETKVWCFDLVELWIWLHKVEYAMFEDFKANEDTLRRKQNTDFENRMKKFRNVDEILFKQLQDNSVPKPMFQTSGNLDVMLSMKDLAEINKNMVQMVTKAPVDTEIIKEASAHLLEVALIATNLYQIFYKHAVTGNELTNLRDNRKRDEIVLYVRKELQRLIRVSNQKYQKFKVAKDVSYLKLNN